MLTTIILIGLATASTLSCATLIAACILSARSHEDEPVEAHVWSIAEVKLEAVHTTVTSGSLS